MKARSAIQFYQCGTIDRILQRFPRIPQYAGCESPATFVTIANIRFSVNGQEVRQPDVVIFGLCFHLHNLHNNFFESAVLNLIGNYRSRYAN